MPQKNGYLQRAKLRWSLAEIYLQKIIAHDKTSLDTTWLKDKSLADLDHLPDPDVLAANKVRIGIYRI